MYNIEELYPKTGLWGAVVQGRHDGHVSAMSATQLDIVVYPTMGHFEGTAFRGKLVYRKIESTNVMELRSLGRRLGLPKSWVLPKLWTNELPEVVVKPPPVASAPVAAPVTPALVAT